MARVERSGRVYDESTAEGKPGQPGQPGPRVLRSALDIASESGDSDSGLRDGASVDASVAEHDQRTGDEWTCAACPGEYFEGRAGFLAHLPRVHPTRKDDGVEPCVNLCVWLCSVCGKKTYWPTDGTTHGGPPARSYDRRFGFSVCEGSRYPGHKRAIGTIDGARGPVVLYHEGLTFSEQPEQDDPTVVAFLPKPKPKRVKKEKQKESDPVNRVVASAPRAPRVRRSVAPVGANRMG